VQRAAAYAKARNISVEVLVVLDSPSQESLSYFERNEHNCDEVVSVDFDDTGRARNRGVQLSSGRYLAFLDAPHLFCENWLAAAFQLAEADAKSVLVLHPELSLYFGPQLILESSINSDADGYSPLELIEFNPWTPLSFASGILFESNPFPARTVQAPGQADWYWNCEVLANGATHRIVPGTVHFLRISAGPNHPPSEDLTFGPSRLFDLGTAGALIKESQQSFPESDVRGDRLDGVRKYAATQNGDSAQRGSRLLSPLLQRGRKMAIRVTEPYPNLLNLCIDVASATRTYLASRQHQLPGNWFIDEWRRMHEVDPDLYPTETALRNLQQRPVPRSRLANLYSELYQAIGSSPTHIYLLPWLNKGGAELEAIQYMTAANAEGLLHKIVCITTENKESEWLEKIPKEIRVVDFGNRLTGLSQREKVVLLTRLLLQKRARVIHNFNSAVGYEVFANNGATLALHAKLFATVFGFEFLSDGRLGGYSVTHLPVCIDSLSRVFTDSRYFVERLVRMFGFDETQFSVVYVPAPTIARRQPVAGNGVLNVLWASRMDVEKRVDVLLKIAAALTQAPIHFHVYGEPVLHPVDSEVLTKLRALPNLTLHGPYQGFESIPTSRFDVFLYTSERDGLPNVLLEATAAGLPVIAPDVGGIRELINEDTGFLVSGSEGVGEYAEYLKALVNDYGIAAPKLESARALIEARHSWPSFVEQLRQVPDYFMDQP
jgi:glycosyltransferase involved in cell wall biosynthesis